MNKKKKNRQRDIQKRKNIRRNNTPALARYYLEVNHNDEWMTSNIKFKTKEEVSAYISHIDELREKDLDDIVEGRIIDRKKMKIFTVIAKHTCTDKTEEKIRKASKAYQKLESKTENIQLTKLKI